MLKRFLFVLPVLFMAQNALALDLSLNKAVDLIVEESQRLWMQ